VKIEAGPSFYFQRKFQSAFSQVKTAGNQVQNGSHIVGVHKGAKVEILVVFCVAGDFQAGEFFLYCERQVWKVLVVFLANIVIGLVFGYQVCFQNQGFGFGFGYYPFYVRDVGEHERCRSMVYFFPAVKITANPFVQEFCLADIYDFPL
jgi:hypothetical protein